MYFYSDEKLYFSRQIIISSEGLLYAEVNFGVKIIKNYS